MSVMRAVPHFDVPQRTIDKTDEACPGCNPPPVPTRSRANRLVPTSRQEHQCDQFFRPVRSEAVALIGHLRSVDLGFDDYRPVRQADDDIGSSVRPAHLTFDHSHLPLRSRDARIAQEPAEKPCSQSMLPIWSKQPG